MILEATQLLNNACIHHNNSKSYIPIYKQTHKNHPCSIWTAESLQNFEWLTNLSLALCKEYTYRYNKTHKCEEIINKLSNDPSKLNMKDIGQTEFKLCMPDEYKIVGNAVESYRKYYINEKAHIAKWKNRPIPYWWK